MKSPEAEDHVEPRRVRRRPPKLELDKGAKGAEGATEPSSLRTPLEIANDIAIQCVSPGISTFLDAQTRDAVVMSRTIEAEQRRLIAQRAGEPHPKRRPPPLPLDLAAQDRSLSINSAPLLARKGAGWPRHPPRAVSTPSGFQRATVTTDDDAHDGRPTTTTIYVRKKGDSRGAQSSVPSFPGRRAVSEAVVEPVAEEEDPEDAALSDAEEEEEEEDPESKAIDAEDELKTRLKRRRVEPKPESKAPAAKKRRFLELCAELWDLMNE